MSLLGELTALISPLVPVETGLFSETVPDRYVVLTPMVDAFLLYTDDKPRHEVQEARLSLFAKGNYTKLKNELVCSLIEADFLITERRYVGHEDESGYHHYAIDVAKNYELEE